MRAAKVHETEFEVTTCPVCKDVVTGKLTVEVHLGDVTVSRSGGDSTAPQPHATAHVTTRMRSIEFSHKCAQRPLEAEVPTDVDSEPEQGDGAEG